MNTLELWKKDDRATEHGDVSPFPEISDEIPSSERLRRFETNAAAASFLAVTALAHDSLSSIPPTLVKDVPSSLRCLSLTMIFILGSPIVVPSSEEIDLEWSQRGVALFALQF